jgi:hypothetical protein
MKTIVAALGAALLAGCGTAPRRPAVGEELALEVETFRLTSARASEREGAGGGRIVLFESDASRAEAWVELASGTYEVTVILDGPDADHDAVYVSVAEDEYRVHPEPGYRGCLSAAARRPEVCVWKDGAMPVVFRAAETGVSLDRLILKRVQ